LPLLGVLYQGTPPSSSFSAAYALQATQQALPDEGLSCFLLEL